MKNRKSSKKAHVDRTKSEEAKQRTLSMKRARQRKVEFYAEDLIYMP